MSDNKKPTDEVTVFKNFIAVQAELQTVIKDRANPYFKSNYATLEAIVAMLRPILASHKMAYTQTIVDGRMVTNIIDEGPLSVSSSIPFVMPTSGKPQDMGSAITYAKRYGLQMAFGIVVADDTDDDDGNRANGNRGLPKVTPDF